MAALLTIVLAGAGGGLAVADMVEACTPQAQQQAAAVVPAATPCVEEVIADALKRLTLPQILADVGPTCATSIEQIVTILLGANLTEHPDLVTAPAYLAARAHRGLP